MPFATSVLGRLVQDNNARVRRAEGPAANPRPLDGVGWHAALAARHADIRSEWDAFAAAGGRLPLIEDLLDEHQGNEGPWRAGLLVSRGRPVHPLADLFPATIDALGLVDGLWSALWSELDAGAVLPEHSGPNAGVFRYHLGVRCGAGAALRVGEVEVPYRDGEGVLFDDTVPHSARNSGAAPRVTLFCEVLRPLPAPTAAANRAVQRLLALDRRYRDAPRRAAAWHAALNHRVPVGAGGRS